jgi:hypothetical protein
MIGEIMADTHRAHAPIKNNDDWLAAQAIWTADVLAKFMTGQRLSMWEQRFIDLIRAQIGAPPESPKHYMTRLTQEVHS